jgi:hypothetical protein
MKANAYENERLWKRTFMKANAYENERLWKRTLMKTNAYENERLWERTLCLVTQASLCENNSDAHIER